jgi:hypothetical protein
MTGLSAAAWAQGAAATSWSIAKSASIFVEKDLTAFMMAYQAAVALRDLIRFRWTELVPTQGAMRIPPFSLTE